MARRLSLALVALALFLAPALFVGSDAAAQTPQTTTTLRIAVLAPRGSRWHQVFTAWGNSLRTRTNGQLALQIVNASAGDEASLVSQMRAGQLDGALFTSVGLGQVARPSLVLQAPGVFESYAALDCARTAMDPQLRPLFEQNGAVLLGWADWGQGRIFSTAPIAQPSDLRGRRVWVLPGDPIAPAFLSQVGATPVPLPIGGVMAALNSGQVDTVIASASAVSALQWHTRLTHVTRQSSGAVLVGGTVINKARYDALSPELQTALRETAATAHQRLQADVRRDDERFFTTLTSRGMTAVDASDSTAAWRAAAQQTRDGLVGNVFDRALLTRALARCP